jgi:hypothetical protein
MENIHFLLKEKDISDAVEFSPDDLNTLWSEADDLRDSNLRDSNLRDSNLRDSNISLKELTKIFSYYGIPKNKMVKYEMLQMLYIFETEPENQGVVNDRRRLWKNIKELQHHPFFSKYILFDI